MTMMMMMLLVHDGCPPNEAWPAAVCSDDSEMSAGHCGSVTMTVESSTNTCAYKTNQ